MPLEVSGAAACSFCSKPRAQRGVLVGAVGRTPAICEACVQICLDISAPDPSPPPRPVPPFSLDELDLVGRARVAAGVDRLRRLLDERPAGDRCGFCDAHRRDVAKLISGPGVFICDRCARDASAISRTMPT